MTIRFYSLRKCGKLRFYLMDEGLTPNQAAALRLLASDRKGGKRTIPTDRLAALAVLGHALEQVPYGGVANPTPIATDQ